MDTQIIKCGRCGGSIRVPRNMGRLRIICPLCKYEFLFNSDFPVMYVGDQAPGPSRTGNPGAAAPGPAGNPAGDPARRPEKKRGSWRGVLAVFAVLLVIVLGMSALEDAGSPSAPDPTPGQTVTLPFSFSPQVSASPQLSAYERASELIPNFELRYFLSGLDETELDVVCTLYEAAMNYEESCTFEKRVEIGRFNQLFRLIAVECPELFQLDYETGYTYFYDKTTQKINSCQLTYLIADQSEYEEMRRSCETVINGFVPETSGLSDYEKEKYVFDYIASNCWYSVDAAYAGTPYGALVSFEAKCDGFSGAMKWSMETLGIQCLTVSGDPVDGSIGHAWNIIGLDGSYYMLDVTASVHDTWQAETGIDEVVYRAFNVSDALNTKYELRDFFAAFAPVPVCDSMNASYYARTGHLVPTGGDPVPVLSKELEGLAAAGGGAACIQFESKADFEAFCGDTCNQALKAWLDNYGKPWNYTWWDLNYNVFMVRVEW